jgi:hypothetical protein
MRQIIRELQNASGTYNNFRDRYTPQIIPSQERTESMLDPIIETRPDWSHQPEDLILDISSLEPD